MRPFRRQIQMIFQDPYGSLNPRRRVGAIIGEPFAVHKTATGAERKKAVQELMAQGRAQPGALQPVPGGILRRPAAADRGGPGARAAAQADHLRRAGLRPRRVDPGAGTQPARRPAERVRAVLPVHRARPGSRQARQQHGHGDVPGPGRRVRSQGPGLRRPPGIRIPRRCCPPRPPRTRTRPRSGGGSSSPATCRPRSTRPAAAGSIPAAPRRRNCAASRIRCWRASSATRTSTRPPATTRCRQARRWPGRPEGNGDEPHRARVPGRHRRGPAGAGGRRAQPVAAHLAAAAPRQDGRRYR